ncbi:MAG TPA: radical SAM family heme chaperone HemW [Candidatus Eisenbacteria bacterium]
MTFGLYVHVPYCRSLCPYCDYVKGPLHRAEPGRFVEAIAREAALARVEERLGERPRTVYLGGGTPTSLPPAALARLLDVLAVGFDLSAVREFTVEANPEGLTTETLARLRSAGANRLSLGVQSLEPGVLRTLGRIHTQERAIAALDQARDAGFANLSVDLMYGVPGETPHGVARALEELIRRRVPHVSAYPLQVEEGTPFAARVARGTLRPPDEDCVHSRYESLVAILARAGYRHYEVSNFALPGFESRHNEGYWTRRPYLGLGPGAHSFDGRSRWRNEGSLPRYLARIEAGELPRAERETLAPEDHREERVFLALRRARGLRRGTHLRGFPAGVVSGWAAWAREAGAVTLRPGSRIRPTAKGLLVAHDLAAELFVRARLTPGRPPC